MLFRLLAEAPDPDQALNLFERLTAECNEQLLSLLNKNAVLLHYTIVIFGYSYWLGEYVIQNSDIFYALARDKNLERSLDCEDFRQNFARFRAHSLETEISVLLARFKKHEYVRIVLRDVLGIATLAETTAEISALADVLIEEALRAAESQMRNRRGLPEYQDAQGRIAEATFAAISLGKLGGGELNYSSDVDLLYIYNDHENDGANSLREYFVRQAQLLTDILSRATREGIVFRIDLRLRPQGAEGEPALGIRHALNYYAHAAHDWELQALIKARYCAGDQPLARRFIRAVEPYVYKREINFEAVETALRSRERIGAHRRRLVAVYRENDSTDVKLDRGGIRDIEFLVQCLQRVYGGEERWLRPGGTLFSLQKLHDKGHLSSKDFHDLTIAYEFLRKVEHRLQLQRAQQRHRLPTTVEELQTLARAVDGNYENPAAFLVTLKTHMAAVAEIYDRTVRRQRQIEKGELEPFRLTPPPVRTVRELSFDQVLQRIALDSPELSALVGREDLSLHARRSLHKFLSSAMTSADRYANLLENPHAVERAFRLFESSDYLTDVLIRHPDVLRALKGVAPPAEGLLFKTEPDELFPALELRDTGEAMANLRRTYRRLIFASGARDVLYGRSAADAMLENSSIADGAIRSALEIAEGGRAIAIFALGRLGTMEFDIASDADLIFVRGPQTDGEKARSIAEKFMHALAAYTREGTVFAVDPRLRPRGAQGELVITPAELAAYLEEEAQPWEALTYTKLRFIAGAGDLAQQVLLPVHERITAMAAESSFAQSVIEMRSRLEKSNRYAHSFKLAAGGFYDVDFMASCMALKAGLTVPEQIGSRLRRLAITDTAARSTLEELQRAAILYRSVDHAIRLVTGRSGAELPSSEHARHAIEVLVNRMMQRPHSQDLQRELDETATRVRVVFNEYLKADC